MNLFESFFYYAGMFTLSAALTWAVTTSVIDADQWWRRRKQRRIDAARPRVEFRGDWGPADRQEFLDSLRQNAN